MYNVGIIGNGFVGGAVAHGLSAASTGSCNVLIYDKDPSKTIDSLDQVVNRSDFVFVTVPTPMQEGGGINLNIIFSVFEDITKCSTNRDTIFILKSTVIPGTTELLKKKYPKLNIIFNPEFLTERTARLDFINQDRIILGGVMSSVERVESLYKNRFKSCRIIKTNPITAELLKYFSNVFFSVKISFANEMKMVCEKIGAEWPDALSGFVADGRVADSHLNVPGPDGKLGFGGKCFPKDINAFISFAESVGVEVNTIKGAWKTNTKVRPNE